MNNEEKFKKLVKDMLAEPVFSYDAANWQRANQKLEADSKGKIRFNNLLFTGLGFGLATLGHLLLSSVNKTPHPLKVEKVEQIVMKEQHLTKNKTEEAQKTEATENNVSNKNPENGKRKDQVVSGPESQATFPTMASNVPVSPSNLHSQSPVVKTTQVQSDSEGKRNQKDQSNFQASGFTLTSKQPKSSETTVAETTQDTRRTQNNQQQESLPINIIAGVHESLKSNVGTIANISNQEQKNVQPEHGATVKSEEPYTQNLIETTRIAAQQAFPKPTTILAPPDTLASSVAQLTLQPKIKTTSFCFVEAGAYYNLGWKYKGATEGIGTNPYLGVSYLTTVGEKLGFSFGLCYTSLSRLKWNTKEIKSSKIVYGLENEVTLVTPLTLNYFVAPFRLIYNISPKQAVMIGYNQAYLLDVQSKVETYSEKMNVRTNGTGYRTGGYVEGFKTFNSQITAGYKCCLYKNLWASGEMFYGLTDLRDNVFFGIKNKETMTGFKMSLTYNLFKK